MSQEDNVGFLYKTMIERDPKKRRVKPIGNQTSLLDFDLGESSDDSDFRIEDHSEETDDDSVDSNDIEKADNDSESQSSGEGPLLSNEKEAISVKDIIEKAQHQVEQSEPIKEKLSRMLICCGCLGDRSDDINEIVECDGCGVTVHEGCYGVSDVESFSSTDSLSQSAPWFCEACSAGVEDPCCELCPNKGGIFKETDVGKWVHLVCALYVPGVAFGEVDRLTSVTLFEMPYSKWGAKACCLCMDVRYARTGVCIECDAGMCHTYFHVTCAQKEGLLSEAHSEEVDQADPFYAHCKLHSDRMLVRKRKRNWLSLQLRATYRIQTLKKPEYKETEEFRRIQRKLSKHRQKYLIHKESKSPPWVPTQKMPRQLTTSASAVRSLQHKAELMGVDTVVLETQDEQIASLMDIRKKWHIPPAFSVEFISYYIDRMARINSMKARLEELVVENTELLHKQQELDKKYDETMKLNEQQTRLYDEYERKIEMYNRVLKAANYIKPLPLVSDIAKAIIPQNYGVLAQLPERINMRKGITRLRLKNLPPNPCTIDDLQEIVSPFRTTLSGEQFILYDSFEEEDDDYDGGRIVVFGTIENLRQLFRSTTWAVTQVTTQGPQTIGLPFIHALLQNKQQISYAKVFNVVMQQAHNNNIVVRFPITVMSDFEIAIINAARKAFTVDSVDCCLFHLGQNLYRHIQSEGLQQKYACPEDSSIRDAAHMLTTLAFVPPQDIDTYFRALEHEIPEDFLPVYKVFWNHLRKRFKFKRQRETSHGTTAL